MESNFNGTNSLMDKFEAQFMECIHSLTKEDNSNNSVDNKDEIKVEVENTIANFIDLARQMECFFLQKRFQLSVLKPELLLKEENIDLRHEISRKDELLKKHAAKIVKWKEFLSDSVPSTVGSSVPIVPPPVQMPLVAPNPSMIQPPPPQMHPMQSGGGIPFGPRAGSAAFQAMGMGSIQQSNPLQFLEKTTNNIMDMNPTSFNNR